MLSGRKTSGEGSADVAGRVRDVTVVGAHTVVTVASPEGPTEVVVGSTPDARAGAAATAGLWRLQWVRLHLAAATPYARVAGTTRHPHVRTVPVAAGLAVAAQGVPTYLAGKGA